MAKTKWALVHGSKHAYHPKVEGSLRDAIAEAAQRSFQLCTTTTVYRMGQGTRFMGSAVAVIGKPTGCKLKTYQQGRETFAQKRDDRPEQELVLDAKKSSAKRKVFKWKKP